MHNTPFTVAGMSSSTSSHHNPTPWGTSSTSTTFGDSLSQSRSHYQSGYLMSAQQSTNSPPGNQRVDEVPVVQTKAKLNQAFARGSTSDFGIESMFQSTRQRQNLADEDAPPTLSVNDIPNEVYLDNNAPRFTPKKSVLESSQFGKRQAKAPATTGTSSYQPLFVIVFGYPADKYSVTAEYFKQLGNSTEPDQHAEISNCFRIGYTEPADAMRAVRKNGETIGGSFMVGAKWADPAQAEALLGQSNLRATNFGDAAAGLASTSPINFANRGDAMMVDEPMGDVASPTHRSNTPSVGTPIRLEPSTSAFKKPAVGGSKPATPQMSLWGTPSSAAANNGGGGGPSSSGHTASPLAQTTTPQKSVLGQVSDLIFGW